MPTKKQIKDKAKHNARKNKSKAQLTKAAKKVNPKSGN